MSSKDNSVPSPELRQPAQIGKALVELYEPSQEAHASKLAYHLEEAVPSPDDHKFAHYSLIAGEQALAAYDHEEALATSNEG